MLELEIGVVKFFDDRDGKKYGFLRVLDEDGQETGEEIFFHFNDGQFVDVVGGDGIQFIGRVFPANGLHITPPAKGSQLAFGRKGGNGGRVKACPWTYAEGYLNRRFQLGMYRYRVVLNDDSNAEVWSAEYNPEFPPAVRNAEGTLPEELTDDFRLEVWLPENIADLPYGEPGVPMAAHWRPVVDQARFFQGLQERVTA